ncbi:hypothetical protein GUI43_02014 [Micromonospora noduli]|nr:hypothetical protein GUI43_02014 [Micromonospora noduli]
MPAQANSQLGAAGSWTPVPLDSRLYRGPAAITSAPVLRKLESLPLDQLTWENFERIQWRVMRDVEGLRHAQIYGERGQSQYGLDVVALAPDGVGVALQSKRYKRFGPAELEAAVTKFRSTSRPFHVGRLIIGVSREVTSTRVVEDLAKFRAEFHPITLDLWDRQELSRLLRGAPEIVIEFFGLPTAEAFCLPFELEPVRVPTADAVAIREALARTPEETTGAAALLREARAASEEPERALALIEEAQAKLRAAGFGSYAEQHETERNRLLAGLGRVGEAARRTLDGIWTALDRGLSTTAQIGQRRLRELARDGATEDPAGALVKVADAAMELYFDPLASLPEASVLVVGEHADQVRLAVLAGETALANDDHAWLTRERQKLAALAETETGDRVLRTRLRLLVAESSGDWSNLLEDARKLRLGHALGGLVTARYARHCALHQRFEEAEALWDEAAGDACLAQRWTDAATWTFSRRAFRSRWKPFTSDELLPLQTALRERGPTRPVIATAEGAYEEALEGLRVHKLRSAAISAQRALRDAVAMSDWVAEGKARQVLAAVLVEADEPVVAARHLTRAGDVEAIKNLGKQCSSSFIDITADLSAPNYWTVGTAYRLIAQQADLIPDEIVSVIVGHIVAEITGAEAHELVDLRSFATSRYRGALGALAGVSDRLTPEDAETVLSHFERQPKVEVNHYRLHDEDEAAAVARIAINQPALSQRAIPHLAALLARSQSSRNQAAQEAIDHHIEIAKPHLAELAVEDDGWAQETLAYHDPEANPPEVVEQALTRLTNPLSHQPGVYSTGTTAVGDSLLVRAMPPARLEPAVAELLRRADDPHVGSSDRGEYLIAASNLAHHLEGADRDKHFAVALRCASAPTSSEHDELDQRFGHRLGFLRIINPDHDSRDRALFLAACLATDDARRAAVRSQAYALLGAGENSDYWPTRALQQLGDALKDDVGFLVAQGWALRSFAAILWARHGSPPQAGARLAADNDVRVRRAFAKALASVEVAGYQSYARDRLAQDPCHSVRSALGSRTR